MIRAIISLNIFTCAVPYLLFGGGAKLYSDAEAYQVYSVILQESRAYADADSTVKIREGTVFYLSLTADCLRASSKYQGLVDSAFADYVRMNRSHWKLTRLFSVSKPYELTPETEFAGFWWKPSSALSEYTCYHPNHSGFIELSAVGFNAAKTIAVVCITCKCVPMCSGGDLLVLQKQEGRWKRLNRWGVLCFWRS